MLGMCQWGMRLLTELENQMTSVERVVEYIKLPSEPPLESDKDKAPAKDWPQTGNVSFKSLNLRYSENGPRILKRLSFNIEAKVSSSS